MDGSPALRIQPFVESRRQGRAVPLMKFRQPDKDIAVVEQSAERCEFARRGCLCLFGENNPGNVCTRRADDPLKRRHNRREQTGIQLEQSLLACLELQRFADSPRAFFVVGGRHKPIVRYLKYSRMAVTSAGIVASAGTISGFKPTSRAA